MQPRQLLLPLLLRGLRAGQMSSHRAQVTNGRESLKVKRLKPPQQVCMRMLCCELYAYLVMVLGILIMAVWHPPSRWCMPGICPQEIGFVQWLLKDSCSTLLACLKGTVSRHVGSLNLMLLSDLFWFLWVSKGNPPHLVHSYILALLQSYICTFCFLHSYMPVCPPGGRTADMAEAMASTRKLVDVLSADTDPKMRNSKFLQFLSKMSKGELIFEDNKV